jgi:hypothetical protein
VKLRLTISAAVAACAIAAASPASAAKPIVATLPAVESACDMSLPTPDAIDCAGYFAGNLLNNSPTDATNQVDAIASLDGDFTFDGDFNSLISGTLENGNELHFGQTLFGETIIGAHFGNVAGAAGNVSVFWLFDFGAAGVDFITLDDPAGFSNAALYTTAAAPGVPEPATWAMLLLGFGAAGFAIRRRRHPALMQMA